MNAVNAPTTEFAERLLRLRPEYAFSYLAKANALAARGVDVVSFGIGQPDFPTPAPIKAAATRALQAGHTGYVPSAGIPEFRQAIADYVSAFTGADIRMDEVMVLPGTKPGIYFSVMAYVKPGDEVVLPDPGFPAYDSLVRYVGATPVYVPLREDSAFRMLPERVAAVLTERTRMIVLNSPHNPTGCVNTRRDARGIVELAKERGAVVVSDEVYDHFIYEGDHVSVLEDPEWRRNVVYVNGLSKTYAMTGWRLGYVVARREVVERLTTLAVNNFSCTANFVQRAGITALTMPQDFLRDVLRTCRAKRNLIHARLNAIPGVSAILPQGAFYIFPNVTERLAAEGVTTEQFTDKLLTEHGIVALPGSPAFPSTAGEGYLRMNYALPQATLEKGIAKLEAALVR
jgi:aspartate aminotransferase